MAKQRVWLTLSGKLAAWLFKSLVSCREEPYALLKSCDASQGSRYLRRHQNQSCRERTGYDGTGVREVIYMTVIVGPSSLLLVGHVAESSSWCTGWKLYCPLSQLRAGLWSFSASVLLIFWTESFFGGGRGYSIAWHLRPLPTGCQQHSFPHICDSPKCLRSSEASLKGTTALDENHGGEVTVASSVPQARTPRLCPRISACTQVSGHWLVLTGTSHCRESVFCLMGCSQPIRLS